MRQPQGPVRYGSAFATPATPVPSPVTNKDPGAAAPAALEERFEEIMDRVHQADYNQVERVAALEEYLTLARADGGETWFDAGAWSEDLADSYLALGLSLPSREDPPGAGGKCQLGFTQAAG